MSRPSSGKRSLIAAASYLPPILPICGGVLLLLNKAPYVRFHAMQSLLLHALGYVGLVVMLKLMGPVGWMLVPVWVLLMFVFWLVGMVEAWKGKRYLLPLVGRYADRFIRE